MQGLDKSFVHASDLTKEDTSGRFLTPPEVRATVGYTISEEEFIVFDGFKTPDSKTGKDAPALESEIYASGYSFYYERETYQAQFLNIKTQSEGEPWVIVDKVPYERVLGDIKLQNPLTGETVALRDFTPSIPDGLDSNFEFKGWCWDRNMTGDVIDINTYTMPTHGIMLYAKWGPPEVKITFDTSTAPQEVRPEGNEVNVFYGDKVPPAEIPAEESSFRYRFTSWYSLIDPAKGHIDTNKRYFNPHEMPAPAEDLTLYMEYYDNNQVTYKVHYVFKDDATGTSVDVASPTDGAGVPDTTVTLKAKEGEQLYPDYQMIYNPKAPKTYDMKLSSDPSKNVYTFYYEKSGSLQYKVKYVDENDNDIIEPETKTVTENVAYEEALAGSEDHPEFYNYTLAKDEPTAKSILLEQDADKNIIIFNYTENTVNISYSVYVADTDYGYITAHDSKTHVEKVVDTVKVISAEQANGATAYVGDAYKAGYEFDGWYDFTSGKLGDKVSDEVDFQPTKPEAGWAVAAYVARFKTKTLEVTFDSKTFQHGEESKDEAGVFVVSGGKVGQSATT